jgi:LacI family transcriptional regulator
MESRMKRRSTLKDIADETGFSTNTVSLALQNSPLVAAETGRTILEVAQKLKYRPNHLARSLVNRQSRTIGLILTNVQNPILTLAAQLIQSALAERGYATLFATSNHSVAEEQRAIDVFLGRQVDGILIYASNPSDLGHILEIVAQGTPVVLLSGGPSEGVEAVSFDARAGAHKATAHLIELGHRRIGLIDNSAALGNPEKREGYQAALAAAGIPEDGGLRADPMGFDAGHAYAAMDGLMRRTAPPTAILAANDTLAIGVLRWCADHGIRVPEEISVVGFDNIEIAKYLRPALTTVNYAAAEVCHRAIDKLLALVATDDSGAAMPTVEVVEPELIVRESSAPRCGAGGSAP